MQLRVRRVCARDRRIADRSVDEHRKMSHLSSRHGMAFSIDVQHDRRIAQKFRDPREVVSRSLAQHVHHDGVGK